MKQYEKTIQVKLQNEANNENGKFGWYLLIKKMFIGVFIVENPLITIARIHGFQCVRLNAKRLTYWKNV